MDHQTEQDRELRDLLKDYPMPEASAAYFDDALVKAARTGARRQRNRWLLTGFGSAIAAGLAIWFMAGVLMTTPDLPQADAPIPEVTIALEEPKTINLVFASATALDSAVLTVTLPEGIELAGFPGQKEISWETSLVEGKNRLPLKLIALTPHGGELLARLEHKDRDREFRLRVDVS
ncbi:MAG: hypothetical protein QNJ07_06130 [Woeseiaceae bacterium]|nr:hypothetical protein [Woeseiaceae bacterium]